MSKRLLWLFGLGVVVVGGCSTDASDNRPMKRFVEDGKEYYCEIDEIGCHGVCIKEDESNCGQCGNLCGSGSVCIKNDKDPMELGKCGCPSIGGEVCSFTCVDSGCWDVSSNRDHCGNADKKCDASKNEFCFKGLCITTCPDDMANCDGRCVNTDNDRSACGGCGKACPQPGTNNILNSYCSNAECRIQCSPGFVDEDDNIENGCEEAVTFTCGNGIVEPGEMCDGLRLNDQTCASVVGDGSTGVLTCRSDCTGFDTTMCSASTTCGNKYKDGAEMCDGGDLGGATCEIVVGPGSTGYLGCQANCSDFDVSGCSTPTTCNNGKLEDGEVCDGSLLRNATCATVVGPGSTGNLACASNCYDYDRSGCTAASVCGNGLLEAGEECDGTSFNGETCESLVGAGSRGSLKCNNCKISTENCSAASTCGDKEHKIDKGEKCDGPNLNGATCASVVGEGSEGTLACRDNCSDFDISRCTAAAKCGNGIVEEGEVCDGMRLNDRTCATEVGFGSTGTLKCNDKCTGFITSNCSASTTCGNGKLETGEVCDTTNLKGATCSSLVGTGSVGTVLCGADCKTYNLSGCSAANSCGNKMLDSGEVCDGTNLNSATCADVVGAGSTGKLSCGDGCKHFDTSNCSKPQSCGDGEINGNEICDGKKLAGRTCADLVGFGSKGTLKCADNCMDFDTSMCTPEVTCGNGKLDAGEVCDGTFLNGATCSSQVGFGSTGTLKCNDKCTDYIKTECSPVKTCGNGVLDAGEVCDGALINGRTCAQQVGFGSNGTPGCKSDCSDFTTGTCTPALTCGNGMLDKGEQCDTNLLNGETCESIVGVGSTGTLKCDSNCQFNTTNCTASRGCGNGTLEDNEECDGNKFANGVSNCNTYAPALYESGAVTCDSNCRVNVTACKSWCGNGVVNGTRNGVYIGEACDGEKFPASSNSCEKVVGAGSTGELSCSEDCKTVQTNLCTAPATCGDGIVNQSAEECDGLKFRIGSDDCSAYSAHYEAGTKVKCLSNCSVDTSSCKTKAYCGDGIVNNDEECDRDAFLLGDDSCASWDPGKYSSGKVKCNNTTCTLDYSACVEKPTVKCGNGKLDANEFCDGNLFDPDIQSCSDWDSGFDGGTLKCTKDCQIDDSACKVKEFCGDGVLNNGEVCDGSKFSGGRTACKTIFADLYSSGSVTCNADCTYNTSACVAYCGNGSLNTTKGEACDGTKFPSNANTCAKVLGNADATGTLKCASDCSAILTDSCVMPSCGDGKVNGTEFCDGTAFRNNKSDCSYWNSAYASGSMTCNADCTLNESACQAPAAPVCGDGIVNQGTEDCDGTALKAGLTWKCADLDSKYASGTLTCNKNCEFNESNCVLKPTTKCGNGQLDDDEWCDGSDFLYTDCAEVSGAYSKGKLKCDDDCDFDYSGCTLKACGDGVLSDDEYCDGSSFQSFLNTCEKVDSRFGGGTLKCVNCEIDTSGCTSKCGNGVLDDDEFCDGSNFDPDGDTCGDWLPGSTGTLSCKSNCEVDTSKCKAPPAAHCGDGIVNTNAEDCDGSDILTTSCVEWSPTTFVSGTLKCTADCLIDESGCVKKPTATCGDGKLDAGEDCDKTVFKNGVKTCKAYSDVYDSGNLKCSSSCKIDTSACVLKSTNTCGNGKLDSGENCDGTKFIDNKDSCTQWGDFASGKVTCAADCSIVTANCIKKDEAKCGDGKVNQVSEECDKTAFLNGSNKCTDFSATFNGGTLTCNSDCTVNTSSCTKPSASKCGNNTLDDDEWCDGSKFFDGITKCSDYSSAYNAGNLKCTNACEFDLSDCTRVSECSPDTQIRCDGQSLQVCDKDEWYEMDYCTGGKYCWTDGGTLNGGGDGDCKVSSEPTLQVNWCSFYWLEMNAAHNAYGRILLPNGKTPNDVLAYMACTNDLSKPVTQWNFVEADHNAGCTDCHANTEFMTVEPYPGVGGTNYCTFIFDFLLANDTDVYACLPIRDGESRPIHIVKDQTKLSADQTRQFQLGSCSESDIQCIGKTLQMCDGGIWSDIETCTGSSVCSVADEGCVTAGASYDIVVTMNDWITDNKNIDNYNTTKDATYSGMKVSVKGAFYVTKHTIDGVTAILSNKSDDGSNVTISNLTSGVGTVSFKVKPWITDSGNGDTVTLNISDGTTTKTVTVSGTDQFVAPKSFTFNNASAQTVTITPKTQSSRKRVLIDDIRWTSAP